MKKTILIIVIALFLVVGITSAYEVQPGDTLSNIAQNANMSLQGLLNINPQIENPDLIHVGNEINTNVITGNDGNINFFNRLKEGEEGIFGAVKFVQVQDMFLSGSGVTSGATSITLDQFTFPNGDIVVMTDFGSIGYGTNEPNTTREENISFTGITQAGSGKATLTGVTRGLGLSAPYTASTTLQFAHAGGTLFRITNSAPFYNELLAKQNDETVTGIITYEIHPQATSTLAAPTTTFQYTTKQYVDNVTNQGAATSTEAISGISELGTRLEMASSTFNGINSPLVLQTRYSSDNTRGFVLGVNQTATTSDQIATTTEHFYAQTFLTSATTTRITRVDLNLKKTLSPTGIFDIKIHNVDDDGKPSTSIKSTAFAYADIETSYGIIELTFSGGAKVSPNTTYAVVIRPGTGIDDSNFLNWAYNDSESGDLYTDGTYFNSFDSGTNWTASTTADFYFQILGNEPVTNNTAVISDNTGKIDWSFFDLTRNLTLTGLWDFTGGVTANELTISDDLTVGGSIINGAVPYYGDGSDGALTITASDFFPNSASSTVTVLMPTSTKSMTVADASQFSISNKVFIHSVQGENPGLWEINTVADVNNDTNVVTLQNATINAYKETTGSDITQVLKVPQYTYVKFETSGDIDSRQAWKAGDQTLGGVVVFYASQGVSIENGVTVSLSGMGFKGGGADQQGEGSAGVGSSSTDANSEGGGRGTGSAGDGGEGMLESDGIKTMNGLTIILGGGGGAGAGSGTGLGGNGGGVFMPITPTFINFGTLLITGIDGGDGSTGNTGGGGGGGGGTAYLITEQMVIASTTYPIIFSGGDGGIRSGDTSGNPGGGGGNAVAGQNGQGDDTGGFGSLGFIVEGWIANLLPKN